MPEARNRGDLGDTLRWHFVDGQGAYFCGEETALLQALEGKRGFRASGRPTGEVGFRGKPTLMQSVEKIAWVPAVRARGGEWFKKAGRIQPESGHS